MPRRMWIKLWTQEVIHGSTLKELDVEERAVWFELLCLAGDSITPGKICISEDIGFTADQLCQLLKIDSKLLHRSIQTLVNVNKIRQNGFGIIEIVNFDKYQSTDDELAKRRDYMRSYRAKDKGGV